jgi:hypothetical protein
VENVLFRSFAKGLARYAMDGGAIIGDAWVLENATLLVSVDSHDGFAVKGPRIEQSRAMVNGRIVTRIVAPGFEFHE